MRVTDLMRTGPRLSLVSPRTTVGAALDCLTRTRSGAAVVTDARRRLLGVFTDGDFRRLMVRDPSQFKAPVGKHMTAPSKFVLDRALVAEAQALMAEKKINALPVVNGRMKVVGLLDIQDLVAWPAL
jgi:arabinose-5-phosphate isomerase